MDLEIASERSSFATNENRTDFLLENDFEVNLEKGSTTLRRLDSNSEILSHLATDHLAIKQEVTVSFDTATGTSKILGPFACVLLLSNSIWSPTKCLLGYYNPDLAEWHDSEGGSYERVTMRSCRGTVQHRSGGA